ncbi:MAG: hypothetical protein JNK12_24190 [Acidimicrobiales bacterium]|nr:hypothetical protein [Acidimicrobiales bacterium]
MLKRLRWFLMGMVAGVAGTVWAFAYGRQKVQELTPAHVAGELATRARSRLDDAKDALFEARLAMREREAELRAGLEGDPAPGSSVRAITVKSSPN